MGPSGQDENQDKRMDPPVAMTSARMRLRHGTHPLGAVSSYLTCMSLKTIQVTWITSVHLREVGGTSEGVSTSQGVEIAMP